MFWKRVDNIDDGSDAFRFAACDLADSSKEWPADSTLAVFHYNSNQLNPKWTTRSRDIRRKKAAMRFEEHCIAYMLDESTFHNILEAEFHNADHIAIRGWRYFGDAKGWVEFVEHLSLQNLHYVEVSHIFTHSQIGTL